MIFGLIKSYQDTAFPQKEFRNIINQISWNLCDCTAISAGSFYGIFVRDKRLPYMDSAEVFFQDDKNEILVFIDGIIYNKQEIADKLMPQQKLPPTPELIFRAFQKWDISFAEKLNGDFAICIHIENKKRTLFFTDHIGIRPLAVSCTGSTTYFSTDAMGLCKALFHTEKIDKDFLLNFFMTEERSYTILPQKKITKVKPGHYLEVTSGHQEHKPYWFPEKIKQDNHLTQSQILEELNQLVKDAVSIRCDNRFVASAHVSGGLDSGIVAALTRKAYAGQSLFYGFSWSPEKENFSEKIKHDERSLVKKVCRKNDIIPVYADVDADDYQAYLSNWRCPSEYIYEKKTISQAQEKGINLIFSGWGGDEFISIGNYGIDSDLIRSFDWKYFMKKYPLQKFKRFVYALYFKALFPTKRQRLNYKTDSSFYPFIKHAAVHNLTENSIKKVIKSRRDFHLYFINRYHLSQRTADWYVHGQRNGIEYRYPLLDKRIVEYMLKLSSRCLVSGKKNRIILREIGKSLLPAEVLSNTLKDDPVSTCHYNEIVRSVKQQILQEYSIFKNNPDLDFIDFELLDNHLHELKENFSDNQIKNKAFIFYYLKWAHEFTKGYYSN